MESGITDIVLPTDQFLSELEQSLYTSILGPTGERQMAVYFLTGHGERITLQRAETGTVPSGAVRRG